MSEWKTERYEGSVGVDGRWVVSRSEAEARLEAAERKAALRDAHAEQAEATLAAVREWREGMRKGLKTPKDYEKLDAILDREREKCPTCGGTDREGGTVATSGPDEFGNYETDDCPDDFHR